MIHQVEVVPDSSAHPCIMTFIRIGYLTKCKEIASFASNLIVYVINYSAKVDIGDASPGCTVLSTTLRIQSTF